MSIEISRLSEKFPVESIEWRVQQSGKRGDRFWAMVLAYVTNRAIMDRLDEVCGPQNWKNDYKQGPDGGILCGLSIKIEGEWITKWDGASNTQVEAVKGGLSGAMKRAAVQWGIGRYLYGLDAMFANVSDKGKHSAKDKKTGQYFKWDPPQLPEWAIPPAMFRDLPKERQDKARAKLFAFANELGVDYQKCEQLGYDPVKKRNSLGSSTVKQVSDAINTLDVEIKARRSGEQFSEKTKQAATAGGVIDPRKFDDWAELRTNEFRKRLVDEVKKKDIRLGAVLADAAISHNGQCARLEFPVGFDWQVGKANEGLDLIKQITGMDAVVTYSPDESQKESLAV